MPYRGFCTSCLILLCTAYGQQHVEKAISSQQCFATSSLVPLLLCKLFSWALRPAGYNLTLTAESIGDSTNLLFAGDTLQAPVPNSMISSQAAILNAWAKQQDSQEQYGMAPGYGHLSI